MGVDTKGYVSGAVTATDIFNVITTKFDKNATFDVKEDRVDRGEVGYIYFNYKDEQRGLFYCIVNDHPEMELLPVKKAFLDLRYWGGSVEIMTEIVREFGGYLDENDCDDEEAYYIPKDGDVIYSEYMLERQNIMNVLDNTLKQSEKVQIAAQIMKHKEALKQLI